MNQAEDTVVKMAVENAPAASDPTLAELLAKFPDTLPHTDHAIDQLPDMVKNLRASQESAVAAQKTQEIGRETSAAATGQLDTLKTALTLLLTQMGDRGQEGDAQQAQTLLEQTRQLLSQVEQKISSTAQSEQTRVTEQERQIVTLAKDAFITMDILSKAQVINVQQHEKVALAFNTNGSDADKMRWLLTHAVEIAGIIENASGSYVDARDGMKDSLIAFGIGDKRKLDNVPADEPKEQWTWEEIQNYDKYLVTLRTSGETVKQLVDLEAKAAVFLIPSDAVLLRQYRKKVFEENMALTSAELTILKRIIQDSAVAEKAKEGSMTVNELQNLLSRDTAVLREKTEILAIKKIGLKAVLGDEYDNFLSLLRKTVDTTPSVGINNVKKLQELGVDLELVLQNMLNLEPLFLMKLYDSYGPDQFPENLKKTFKETLEPLNSKRKDQDEAKSILKSAMPEGRSEWLLTGVLPSLYQALGVAMGVGSRSKAMFEAALQEKLKAEDIKRTILTYINTSKNITQNYTFSYLPAGGADRKEVNLEMILSLAGGKGFLTFRASTPGERSRKTAVVGISIGRENYQGGSLVATKLMSPTIENMTDDEKSLQTILASLATPTTSS